MLSWNKYKNTKGSDLRRGKQTLATRLFLKEDWEL